VATDISERILDVQRKANSIAAIELLSEIVDRLGAQRQRSDDRRQEPQYRDEQRRPAQ
jgi:hypothetical protein